MNARARMSRVRMSFFIIISLFLFDDIMDF